MKNKKNVFWIFFTFLLCTCSESKKSSLESYGEEFKINNEEFYNSIDYIDKLKILELLDSSNRVIIIPSKDLNYQRKNVIYDSLITKFYDNQLPEKIYVTKTNCQLSSSNMKYDFKFHMPKTDKHKFEYIMVYRPCDFYKTEESLTSSFEHYKLNENWTVEIEK
ncbi:hypothetical protein [Nonlabens ulvanivorans]|uniref:Uncharacterized protein n=1 Tax=Nonlabens ulvanivorans TaxID=906888 RepID=A0A084JSN0_NONUL|nr:hypothetical protein [Nonlabens ulvanivorans]KEZ91964.1 hypothetical protein IL45_14800 [Nonlabens ulvanivorans]PRX10591.1 hypothetical protein LY02_02893 [Nonlabens ulvanivorans]